MSNDVGWMVSVLTDLKEFCCCNDMPNSGAALEKVIRIAIIENEIGLRRVPKSDGESSHRFAVFDGGLSDS